MKFLCICDGGNVRSRALAYVLHDLMGHEAIAIGRKWASPQTMDLLCDWADVIATMQPHMLESVPVYFRSKVQCVDVGPDTYGLNIDNRLMAQVMAGANRLTGRKIG